MKKVIAFDLDGTLAPSKSPLPDRIGAGLDKLLENYQVCVISGGRFEQFEMQLLNGLMTTPDKLQKLHLFPTCGTQYFRYDVASGKWERVYAELLNEAEKKKIIEALKKGFDDLGFTAEKTYGAAVEDRESQITYSALGQDIVAELGEEGLRIKHEWDPDNSKKMAVRNYVAPLIPEFEVRVGGVTSVDVTKPGIDKAYGMQKLMGILEIGKEDILFFGDRLNEGGNDYPVLAFGIDSLEISDWKDTALAIETIVHVTS